MSDPAFELQKAMRAAILADDAPGGLQELMGDPVALYDHVPEKAPMPYIQHDEPGTSEWDVTPTETDDGFGHEHTIMLHVWSSYEGKMEVSAILYRLEVLFRNWSATLNGHRLVNFRYQFSDRLRDPDGQAYHGVIQFRAITEEVDGFLAGDNVLLDANSANDGLSSSGGFIRVNIDELPSG